MNNPGPAILIVDDDPTAVELIGVALRSNGFENVESCSDPHQTRELITTRSLAVLLLDLVMPEVSGFDILEFVAANKPELPVIVLTANDSVDAAVRCMRIGAFDFMVKPLDRNRLVSAVNHALRVRELEDRLTLLTSEADEVVGPQRSEIFDSIITASQKMRAIFQYIETIGPSPKSVLITGESGTGKELIARAIHDAAVRTGPFVPVNVAGLDDVMFSDTLFGHVRGAFTGADRARNGLVEKAQHGTLFLDEIGDMELTSQVKLLRLLQEGEFYQLGSDEPRRVSLRVVAATNADLAEKQRKGLFRRDLYYRLISHLINVPPLRERPEDIEPLFRFFLSETAEAMRINTPPVLPEAIAKLREYSFPGNVRELQAIVTDAVTRRREDAISSAAIDRYLRIHASAVSDTGHGSIRNRGYEPRSDREPESDRGLSSSDNRISWTGAFPSLEEVEVFFIAEALRRCEGNQTAAADLLGVAQSTLSRRVKKDARLQRIMHNA